MADNGLRFQIRHGSPSEEGKKGIPEGSLKPYELGWAYNNGLYMGYTKEDNTTGIFRIVPYGLDGTLTQLADKFKGYLPLAGGVLTGNLTLSPTNQTSEVAYITERKIGSIHYRTKTYVSERGFAILGIGSLGDDSKWKQLAYLAVGKDANGVIYASMSGNKIVTEADGTAPQATQATKDGAGNTITSTYLKITDAKDTYLKLTGGTLSGGIAIKKIVNNIETTTSLTPDTYTETKYITTYLSNNPSTTTLASGILINELGLYYRIEKEVNSGTYTYYKCLHSGNYSTYALPLSGGTLTGSLKFSSGAKNIIHTYNDTDYEILRSANTGNVGLNAKGAYLYLGYYNTTRIYLSPKGENSTAPIVIIGPGTYGTSLPSSGVTGQIFFKLES